MDLEAVYPNVGNPYEEISFEELRAESRGWRCRDWAVESKQRLSQSSQANSQPKTAPEQPTESRDIPQILPESQLTQSTQSGSELHDSPSVTSGNTIAIELSQEGKTGRPKKTKIREVKGETQTSALPLPATSQYANEP